MKRRVKERTLSDVVEHLQHAVRSASVEPLQYAPAPNASRRKIVRWSAVITIACFAVAVSVRFAAPALHRFELIRLQNRCLDYQPAGKIALSWDAASDKTTTIVPQPWGSFYAKLSPPGMVSSGTMFLGRLYTPEGLERLVAVDLSARRGSASATARMFEPGTLMRQPAEMHINIFANNMRFDAKSSLTIYQGDRDPADSSHFTAPYEMDGRKGVIDGWITGDNTVVLEDRNQNSTKQ